MAAVIPYLLVEQVTKSVGAKVLFRDVSFAVNEGDRIALVARNGIGKSTLLDILMGRQEMDSGKITLRKGIRVGYLPQVPTPSLRFPLKRQPFEEQASGREGEEAVAWELRFKQLCEQLGVGEYLLDRCAEGVKSIDRCAEGVKSIDRCAEGVKSIDRFAEGVKSIDRCAEGVKTAALSEGDRELSLSGGQAKRLAIARVLADEPDLLLLDEPTNHLDLEMVAWLEDYLTRNRSITLLMVTHDRWFLDKVCNTIIELDQNNLYTYRGHYADYLEQRAARIEQQNAEADKFRNLYRTELDWMRRMPQARGHKSKNRIENFYEIERKAKATIQEQDVRLAIESGYIGNKIFEAKHVSKAFEADETRHKTAKVILNDFSYIFARYEKLGIIGKNGTGKSTFLKLLLGEVQPDAGCFDIGTTVRFGYYAQTGLAFDEGKKVIDIVRDIAETVDMGEGQRLTASQFLQHFLFSPEQQYDYVAKLSGGERQRLHLCTVLMRSPNFLILDEPTNDLDIPTLNVLEAYLRAFKGCLIVVSHDRYFMDKVVDHLFVFHGEGKIQDFPGNYTQWREYKAELDACAVAASAETGASAAASAPAKRREDKPRKLTFAEKKELEQLEVRMPELEVRKQTLEHALSGGVTEPEAIAQASKEYEQVTRELDEAEMRWLELSEV